MTDLENLMAAAENGSLDEAREILARNPELVHQRDELGATPLHIAAFNGHRKMAELLLEHGADINAIDAKYGATPAGWAIEYLRERGAFLGIELGDFAWAIQHGKVEWVERMLARFPKLREAASKEGIPFKELVERAGNSSIIKLFEI